MKSDELLEMKLSDVSDYLLSRLCELGEDQVGVELKGKDDKTEEIMVLTVILRKGDLK